MVIEAMKLKEEKELVYSDENETRELGCIGHLRGDFGRHGSDFYSQWFPHKCHDLKDDKFKIIFDAIVNKLRSKGNVLANKGEMYNICRTHNEWALTKPYGGLWGFRITTDDYALYVRCSTVRDDYNFYIYCYDKNMLMTKLAKERGLPCRSYAYLPTTGEVAQIDFAEGGYIPVHADGSIEMANKLNKEAGVTPAQAAAMKAGSMFGWDVPAADPSRYDEQGKAIKKRDSREER